MKVGLITYQAPHSKTREVLEGIISRQYQLKIYGLPFRHRVARKVLFDHRPDKGESVMPETLAQIYGIQYIACNEDIDIDNSCDLYLILGAGILSKDCVKGKKIINCHPGIIPSSRGLDSFKWSLYMMRPLGVTLHFIDEQVDLGQIISVVPTTVYWSDNLEILALRHYKNEIECLCQFEEHLVNPNNLFEYAKEFKAKMRMPHAQELELVNTFDLYKKKYAIHKID